MDIDASTRREVFSTRRASAMAIAVVLLLITLGWQSQREQLNGREIERAVNLARAFEFHVQHEIQAVDDLLRQLRKMPLDSAGGFHQAVRELRAGALGQRLIQFALIGADGYLRYSTATATDASSPDPHVFLGDREHFKAHLDPGVDRLFISRPVVGRLTGQLSIQFSRPYADATGRLLGVIVISMPPGFLTDGTESLALRAEDVATILRQDGYLLARTPVMPDSAKPRDRLPADFLTRFDGFAVGVFEALSPIDQVRRLIAFRKTSDFPLTVLVAPSTRYRDLELRQAMLQHLALALVVVALLIAFHVHHERALRLTGKLRRDNEREQRHLADAQAIAQLGSWRFDVADQRCEWSPEVYRILGLPAGGQALSHDDFLSRVHADDRLALDAAFGRIRESGQTGESYELRHRIVRPDGTIRHVIQHGQVEFDRRGLLSRFTGTIQDVTEALEAEFRLLEAARSDRLARAVFDGVMQPMLVLSAEGRLIDVNRAFEETFAVSGDALRGRLLAELELSPEGAVAFACGPSRLFRYDQPVGDWEGDVVVARDGGEIVLSLTLSGIRDAAHRIEHYVGIYADVTRRKRREKDAVHQSRHDPMTGLPNRQYAMERLARSLHRARRRLQQGVLIFIDLDRFKEINDTYGHEAGDEVLRVVAHRFQAAIRQEDMMARLGGDEFVALLEEVSDMDVVRRVAEAIRTAAAEPISYAGAASLKVSASLGIAVFPTQDEDAESLLARADQAMYEAKRDGRDAVRFWAGDAIDSPAPRPDEQASPPAGGDR